ncbi:MAG: HU family DNA-binding protein [Methylococcales bacterium]|nr:HU family DNA-binding protein [Methylococcales bacterium]
MISALEKGERIAIRGFGGFSIRHMSARKGRNPKTGEAIQVLPRSMVHFKSGLEMRERVNNTN